MTWHTAWPAWRSGPWFLDLRDDELADIAYEGRVALRSIRAVVRDREWATAAFTVDRIDSTATTATLHVRTTELGFDLRGSVHVEVDATSALRVSLDLETAADVDTNRTGLVVLHPAGVAGCPLEVIHASGPVEHSEFPAEISAHQPAFDIAGLGWIVDGLAVDLRFSGDVFEMEDQRNWSDASFKTYSRPLALPFPYRLAAGSRIRQSVEMRAAVVAASTPAGSDTITLAESGVFPDIVVGAATAPDPAPVADRLGAAVLVELDLASSAWHAALDRAARSGQPLDVRFVLADDDPDALFAAAGALRDLDVRRVAAFQRSGDARHVSDAAAVDLLRRALAAAGETIPIVGGARSHFTELNRERHRLPDDLDGLVFSTTPLFHARGTEQLVESLAMQRLIVEQAVRLAGALPVHVGPIALRPRFNDAATTPPPMPAHADLRDGYGPALIDADDERQDAPELAAWTIASAAALAVPGTASIAFFEEWGPRGVRSSDGADRAVADAVRALDALRGARLLHGASPDGLVWAIGGLLPDGTETILVANVDRRERAITVRTPRTDLSAELPAGSWSTRRA